MRLSRLWLRDFRCYETLDVPFGEGCTVITGANGQGKTSLLEAVAWNDLTAGVWNDSEAR